MNVSVSLVTHQSRDQIDACLAGVRAQGGFVREILVVDNASRDGTVERLRARHPDARVAAWTDNAG